MDKLEINIQMLINKDLMVSQTQMNPRGLEVL
jgi:hypothetical protein